MRLRVLLAALLLAPAVPAGAARVDVVVLRNGTRVVGEIRSMAKSSLELKTDDMGTIKIEWDNVTQVTAPEFFEVENMAGTLHFGSLRPGPGEGTLEVVALVADWGNAVLPLREVARIQLVKSGFWDRFRGTIDLGASYTSASELLELQLDTEVRYRKPRHETIARADGVLTRQTDVEDTRRASLTLSHARLLPERHRIFLQGVLEQNRELGYDLRAGMVAGWGYMLARDSRNELLSGAGLALNRETPVEGESSTNVEAVLGLDYSNFAYDFPNTDVRLTAFGFFGLDDWGRFRLESSASLRREVISDFYLGVRGYLSYDSRPATQGAEKNDWGLSLTLGYSFP